MDDGKLGGAIRAARLAQHISQETLAEMVSITPTHLTVSYTHLTLPTILRV